MAVWVFGYGSLLWKPDFEFEQKLIGYVKGYKRRFYQRCCYHRGTPGKPGRVVTLVPSSNSQVEVDFLKVGTCCICPKLAFHLILNHFRKVYNQVWGIAYKIKTGDEEDVLKKLDLREGGGYERVQLMFHAKDASLASFPLIVYVGSVYNEMYVGEAAETDIAHQINGSKGCSGTNAEYALRLAAEMRSIAPDVEDDHLFAIERVLLELQTAAAK